MYVMFQNHWETFQSGGGGGGFMKCLQCLYFPVWQLFMEKSGMEGGGGCLLGMFKALLFKK